MHNYMFTHFNRYWSTGVPNIHNIYHFTTYTISTFGVKYEKKKMSGHDRSSMMSSNRIRFRLRIIAITFLILFYRIKGPKTVKKSQSCRWKKPCACACTFVQLPSVHILLQFVGKFNVIRSPKALEIISPTIGRSH